MTQTKDMRLVLKRKQDIEQFNAAKAKAERELGYTLRDNEFATRVLAQAVKSRGLESLPVDCRERLRLEGRAYPKSGCASCGTGGMTGCPHKID